MHAAANYSASAWLLVGPFALLNVVRFVCSHVLFFGQIQSVISDLASHGYVPDAHNPCRPMAWVTPRATAYLARFIHCIAL